MKHKYKIGSIIKFKHFETTYSNCKASVDTSCKPSHDTLHDRRSDLLLIPIEKWPTILGLLKTPFCLSSRVRSCGRGDLNFAINSLLEIATSLRLKGLHFSQWLYQQAPMNGADEGVCRPLLSGFINRPKLWGTVTELQPCRCARHDQPCRFWLSCCHIQAHHVYHYGDCPIHWTYLRPSGVSDRTDTVRKEWRWQTSS